MFCSKCGTQIGDDDLFCLKCGARIEQEKHISPKDKEQTPQKNISQQEAVENAISSAQKNTNQQQTSETLLKQPLTESTLLKTVSIFLIVIGALGISIYSVSFMHAIYSELSTVLSFLNFLDHSITLRGFFTVISFTSKIMLCSYFVYSIISGIRGCKQENVKKCDNTANMLLIITAINILLTAINDYRYYNLHGLLKKIATNLVYIYPLQIALPALYKLGTNKFKNLNPTQIGE